MNAWRCCSAARLFRITCQDMNTEGGKEMSHNHERVPRESADESSEKTKRRAGQCTCRTPKIDPTTTTNTPIAMAMGTPMSGRWGGMRR